MNTPLRRTNVYVDGFNLYYGCLKGTPYRWLDLTQLCQAVLTNNMINRIRYFTALVQARPGHPHQQQHQLTYLRALKTFPHITVHEGHFLSTEVMMPLVNPPTFGPPYVKVIKTEEKGSDVNIATHLLMDCFHNEFEVAIIISNDSDLVEPIRVVRKEFKRLVGVVSPYPNVAWSLKKNASFYRTVDASQLAVSQLPPVLTDANGTITKPILW